MSDMTNPVPPVNHVTSVPPSSSKPAASRDATPRESTILPPGTAPERFPRQIKGHSESRSRHTAFTESSHSESVNNLNQILADTMTLSDLYKKYQWQVTGPTFYPLQMLFDKHCVEQRELVDIVAERIMTLGGVSVVMAADAADITLIPRPPKGREDTAQQLSRLMNAHFIVLEQAHTMAHTAAELGDNGTADLLIGDTIRRNERQAWCLKAHVLEIPVSLPISPDLATPHFPPAPAAPLRPRRQPPAVNP